MNLYVGNVPKGTKNRELQKLFEAHGKVVSAAIARDRKSGVSRGFAFVEMAGRREGEQAIAVLNDTEFKGQRLHVNEARGQDKDGGGHGDKKHPADRWHHATHGHMRGGWDHGARGGHTNRGQGGKRGL